MKAFVVKRYGEIHDIEQIDVAPPAVGADEVLVKVKSAAINPADIKVITGKNGGKFIHSGRSPIALGFDFSGVVMQVGDGVAAVGQGDEVFGFLPYSTKNTQGTFAEYVAVRNGTIAKKPPSVSHTQAAAAATAASTALQALVNIGDLTRGKTILVNGASGGVGGYAVQIAKGYDAQVWGTCSAMNLDYTKSIGADHALDYRQFFLKDLTEKFDIILDVVSNSSFSECSGIMAPKGAYLTLLPSFRLAAGKFQSLFSSKKCSLIIVRPKTDDLNKIGEMIEKKMITIPVTTVFPLAELTNALEKFRAGGVRGKIGLKLED